ncbi:MAG: hypothetical protein V2A76_12160, partial [Planctomycetota bacterium]
EQFAFLHDDGEVERRAVTIGKHNAYYVEVLTGLEEGDQVLLYDPREGDVKAEEEQAEEADTEPAAAPEGD